MVVITGRESDSELIALIGAGDARAFPALYARYFDQVFSYLRLVLRRPHEAEDATQEVFMRVIKALPTYEQRPGKPFRAWLFTIARNYALNQLDRLGRLELEDPAQLANHPDQATTEAEPSAQPASLAWLTNQDLLVLIEHMPLTRRQVLVMSYMLDLPDPEIATILNLSPSRIRGIRHEALRFLEARLTALGQAPAPTQPSKAWRYPRQAPVIRSRRWVLTR